MMEENNSFFLAGVDALVNLAGPIQKNSPQHLFGAIHLVRSYLRANFLSPSPFKQTYAFRVTFTAVGLFQKIL